MMKISLYDEKRWAGILAVYDYRKHTIINQLKQSLFNRRLLNAFQYKITFLNEGPSPQSVSLTALFSEDLMLPPTFLKDVTT